MKRHDTIINENYIDVKVGNGIQRVQTKDISFIKPDHIYVEIILNTGKLIGRYTLQEMQAKINLPNFIQCHRSYIINTDKIQKYVSRKVWINEEEIPVGEKYIINLKVQT